MRRLPAAVAGAQPLRWTAGQLPEAEGAGGLTKTGQDYETYQKMVEKAPFFCEAKSNPCDDFPLHKED
jgi:hypothetical protein